LRRAIEHEGIMLLFDEAGEGAGIILRGAHLDLSDEPA
jgi:hypothetical protein